MMLQIYIYNVQINSCGMAAFILKQNLKDNEERNEKYVNYPSFLQLLSFKMILIIVEMITKMHSAIILPHHLSCGNRMSQAKPLSRIKAHKFNCFSNFKARCFASILAYLLPIFSLHKWKTNIILGHLLIIFTIFIQHIVTVSRALL